MRKAEDAEGIVSAFRRHPVAVSVVFGALLGIDIYLLALVAIAARNLWRIWT